MTWVSMGVAGAITLVIAILLVRTITRPFRRLTDAAIAVERRQPFEPADIGCVTSGRDEIAHLGRVFGRMVVALQQEIAERARAEQRIKHLNAVLHAIRNVNQLITREKDRDRLLRGACEELVGARGYHNVRIALLDEGDGLVTSAEAGLGEDFTPCWSSCSVASRGGPGGNDCSTGTRWKGPRTVDGIHLSPSHRRRGRARLAPRDRRRHRLYPPSQRVGG